MQFENVQKHPRYQLHVPVDVVTPTAEVVQLPLENISLGGVFIKTPKPYTAGSTIRLRLQSADAAMTLGLVGRVVHVIDEAAAAKKAHPAGMGVQFEGLSEHTQALLEKFVDGIVAAARRERARKTATRFVAPSSVSIFDERKTVAQLWEEGLDKGGVWVESALSPPLGTRVNVSIGNFKTDADVVHVVENGGFALQLVEFDGKKREAVARYVEGTAQTIAVEEVKIVGPPLGKVLACARRLFTGIEEEDPFSGIGVPPTATANEVRERCQGLGRLFSAPRPDASPPQAARIEAAARAVARLEPVLLARVAAVRRQAELATRPHVDVDDEVQKLMLKASELERKNEKVEARKSLEKALELAPDDAGIKRRLAILTEAIDLARAVELVKSAEVFVNGVGMKHEAVNRAREAARLTKHREVRLLAVRVLAKCGEPSDAVLLAEELLDADPKDPLALQALLNLYERDQDWTAAMRVGEALLRQRPSDAELQKRLKRILEQLRG